MATQLLKVTHLTTKAQIRPTIKAIFWAELLKVLSSPTAITFFVTLCSNFYVAKSQHHFARSRLPNGVPSIGWLLNFEVCAAFSARGLKPSLTLDKPQYAKRGGFVSYRRCHGAKGISSYSLKLTWLKQPQSASFKASKAQITISSGTRAPLL